MKKFCLIFLTLLSCGIADALPVGNPCEASLLGDGILWRGRARRGIPLSYTWSVRMGISYDHLFDKTMRLQVGSKPSIDGFKMSTYSTYLAFNLWDRIDLFGSLGASNYDFEANQTDFSPNTFFAAATAGFPSGPANFTVESSTEFSWGVGLRATLFNFCGVGAGVEGEYFCTRPDIKKVVGLFHASDYPDASLDTKYHEWQVGAGLCYGRLKYFSPYAALRWSTATLRMGGFGTLPSSSLAGVGGIGLTYPYQLHNLESKSNWGFAFGGTFLRHCTKSLTIEGRVGSETAIYVNGQIRI